MKILSVVPHLGGGVGSVIMGWMEKVNGSRGTDHSVMCLDTMNEKAEKFFEDRMMTRGTRMIECPGEMHYFVEESDIVLVHFWDHPMLYDLLSKPLPECRLVFWCHKRYEVPQKYFNYPDLFIDTSPIQGHGRHIWSTGGVDRFLEIQPKPHKGFNVGYVGEVSYQGKMYPDIFAMCNAIDIPNVHFTFVGENKTAMTTGGKYTFTGKVDDVAPYLAEMDVFGYPLRQDHYGTCEQVLGEAMAAGVVPVVMDNPAERLITLEGAKSPDDYVQIIQSLHAHPDKRAALSFACKFRADRLYSINKMVASWNEVFDVLHHFPKGATDER